MVPIFFDNYWLANLKMLVNKTLNEKKGGVEALGPPEKYPTATANDPQAENKLPSANAYNPWPRFLEFSNLKISGIFEILSCMWA